MHFSIKNNSNTKKKVVFLLFVFKILLATFLCKLQSLGAWNLEEYDQIWRNTSFHEHKGYKLDQQNFLRLDTAKVLFKNVILKLRTTKKFAF